jgi:integration host factor subunit alpha
LPGWTARFWFGNRGGPERESELELSVPYLLPDASLSAVTAGYFVHSLKPDSEKNGMIYIITPRFIYTFALTLVAVSFIVSTIQEVGMTKADIISEVFEKVGLPKQDSEELVEMILETIKLVLREGQTVKLSGFGNFVVRSKNARKGRNPKTGQEIEITPRKVVSFRPSMIFKDHVVESTTTA